MKYALALHGGAGTIPRHSLDPEQEIAYRRALREALDLGYGVLARGGAALDAVETAVRALEDCPLFNAGRGAVFTHEGTHELDASLMDGRNRTAGAIAGVHGVMNPISLAQLVMKLPAYSESPHLAFSLAQSLGELMDRIYTENLDLKNLARLVPEDYAHHWQITVKFLEILSEQWPLILQAHGVIDAADRRNRLLITLAGLGFHYLNNQYTGEIVYGRPMMSEAAKAERLAFITDAITRMVCRPDALARMKEAA